MKCVLAYRQNARTGLYLGKQSISIRIAVYGVIPLGSRGWKSSKKMRIACPKLIAYERFGIDQFEPSIDRSLIWSVEFSQQLWIGKSVWDDEAFPARVANQLAKDNNQPIRAKPKDPSNRQSEWESLTPPTHITNGETS